jgi:hypothetical protein
MAGTAKGRAAWLALRGWSWLIPLQGGQQLLDVAGGGLGGVDRLVDHTQGCGQQPAAIVVTGPEFTLESIEDSADELMIRGMGMGCHGASQNLIR